MHPEVLLADDDERRAAAGDHGAPLRVVVPGYIGARSVKWLSRITLQEQPSDNYFQAKAYRLFPPRSDRENVDWETGLMLGDVAVNSVICSPLEGETAAGGPVTVQGGRSPEGSRGRPGGRLGDGGRTWTTADLGAGAGWTWRFWEAPLDLAPGSHEICCRAFDSAAQTQPSDPAQVWNFKGYANNAWHRVRVVVGWGGSESIQTSFAAVGAVCPPSLTPWPPLHGVERGKTTLQGFPSRSRALPLHEVERDRG